MSCHKLEFFSLIFYVKEGKHWKVSLMETFRMIFSLHAGVTPPIPITSFYVIVIIKWLLVALVPGEASVIEKQPSILLITSILNIKINSKTFQFFINSTKTLKMANLYWGKDLFTIRHSLWGGKPTWNNHIWLVLVLWRSFIRWPPVQSNHFWVVPRVIVLYRLSYIPQKE